LKFFHPTILIKCLKLLNSVQHTETDFTELRYASFLKKTNFGAPYPNPVYVDSNFARSAAKEKK